MKEGAGVAKNEPHTPHLGRGSSEAAVALRPLILPVYVPTALQFSGNAAILPILPLIAIRMGFSVSGAAALGLIAGILSVVGTVPAGTLMARVGERRAILATGVLLIVLNLGLGAVVGDALAGTPSAWHRWVLIGALVVQGACMIVWNLGRQAYLGTHLPPRVRARGMTSFGGAVRIGEILGPLLSSAVLWVGHAPWVFYLYSVLVAVAVWCVWARMLEGDASPGGKVSDARPATVGPEGGEAKPAAVEKPREPDTVTGALGRQLTFRDMLRVALGVLPLAAARTNRPIVVPLMAVAMGLTEKDVTLIFGIAAAIVILLFYPAGVIMDRWGRVAAIVPCMSILGLGFALAAPFALGEAGLSAGGAGFAVLLFAQIVAGIGNGLGSGIMMTLGIDLSNTATRTRDLARWNTLMGAGRLSAPLLVSLVTLALPVGWAALLTSGLLWGGAAWLHRVLPEYAPVKLP